MTVEHFLKQLWTLPSTVDVDCNVSPFVSWYIYPSGTRKHFLEARLRGNILKFYRFDGLARRELETWFFLDQMNKLKTGDYEVCG